MGNFQRTIPQPLSLSLSLSLSHTHTHTHTDTHTQRKCTHTQTQAFSSCLSESHGLLCVGSVSTDKSIETAFVLLECKMNSVSEGECEVREDAVRFFLPDLSASLSAFISFILLCRHLQDRLWFTHLKMPTCSRGYARNKLVCQWVSNQRTVHRCVLTCQSKQLHTLILEEFCSLGLKLKTRQGEKHFKHYIRVKAWRNRQ